MQIFSYVILAIIFYIVISTTNSKDRFIKILILNIILATHFESGFFISVTGFELGYDQITSLFTVFFGLLAIKGRLKKGIFRVGVFFYGSILIGVIGLVLFPYGEKMVTGSANNYDEVINGITQMQYASFDSGTISGLLFFLIFLMTVICAYQCLEYSDIEKIVLKLSNYFKWILVLGVIEVVFVYVFRTNVHRLLINTIMGRGKSTFSDLIIRENGFMLQGLTREASHYMFALFISMIVIIAACNIQKKNIIPWLITFIAISILSFSLSSVLSLFGIVLYYFLIIVRKDPDNAKNKILKLSFSIAVGMILLIVMLILIWNIRDKTDNYLLKRLAEAEDAFLYLISSNSIMGINYLSSSTNSIMGINYLGSSTIRLYSVIETFKIFIHRPIFGLGMGVITCHGSTMMFLGDVGVVGLYAWYKLLDEYKKKVIKDDIGLKLCTLSLILYLVINLLSSVYLVPFQTPVALAYIFATVLVFQCNIKSINALQKNEE